MLGPTSKIEEVVRDEVLEQNQHNDLRLTLICPSQWVVEGSLSASAYSKEQEAMLETDPLTCEPVAQHATVADSATIKKLQDERVWTRVTLTILSMMVSASVFASYNVTTFYSTVTLIVGGQVRLAFIYHTFMAWQYEITHPDAIFKLIEACYMKRHELDLVGEEECYRMLQEIVRSPELLKALTGSSLKGSTDPIYDRLSQQDREKLEHLEKLERKGFEIGKLREELLDKVTAEDIHKV